MGLQALINVGYAHTIIYKLIDCSWTEWLHAVGNGPHFFQKNPQQNFLAPGLKSFTFSTIYALQDLMQDLSNFVKNTCKT